MFETKYPVWLKINGDTCFDSDILCTKRGLLLMKKMMQHFVDLTEGIFV